MSYYKLNPDLRNSGGELCCPKEFFEEEYSIKNTIAHSRGEIAHCVLLDDKAKGGRYLLLKELIQSK